MGEAAVVWLDDEGRMRAAVHPFEEAAEEHAEFIAAEGLPVTVVADWELSTGESDEGAAGAEDGGERDG